MQNLQKFDVVIIGAGAAGLMAGIRSGLRGRKTIILEHTDKIGEKIRISGGGRCNFTNIHTSPNNYISENIHFSKSALSQYTARDFITLVESHKIKYHEKTLGQLFCDNSSVEIIDMLLSECMKNMVQVKTNLEVHAVKKSINFYIETSTGDFECESLIIASGGLSIPKIGASSFGYDIATQFSHDIIPTRPALVPLFLENNQLDIFSKLSGISNNSIVHYGKTSFHENILFTHKGLSGPAILQISSYLKNFDETISINMLPGINLQNTLLNSTNSLHAALKSFFAARLLEALVCGDELVRNISEIKKSKLTQIASGIHNVEFKIAGSEGYKKAEVTAGGVNTNNISSKTMESKLVKNLFFIGEVLDVTGWLGGYNFQWAWSSGFAAGNNC